MNKLIGTTMGIAIAIIVTASILMPALSDATQTHETFTNEGMYYMNCNDEASHTISFEKNGDTATLTIDGETITLSTNVLGCTLVAGDDFFLRYIHSSKDLQFKGDGSYITAITQLSGTITADNFTATGLGYPSGGTSGSAITINCDSTNVYSCTAEKTALVMSNYGSSVYMLEDSEIYGFGQNVIGGATLILLKVYGTVEGVTVEVRNSTTGEIDANYTVSDVVIDKTAVSGYLDLYQLNKITFKVTDASNNVLNATFTAYIVPSEVSAELSQHLDSGEIALLNVLPIMIIIGIVMAAIGLVVLRRD